MAVHTLTSVINAALGKIGEDNTIQNAETNNEKRCVIARNQWEVTRPALLRSHPWNCAIKRVTLAPTAAPDPIPDWKFQNYFRVPGDCLRVLEISIPGDDYQVENGLIGADGTALSIRYIADIPIYEMDAQLLDCAIDMLAMEIAMPLLGGAGADYVQVIGARLYGSDGLGGKLGDARKSDGQEGRPRRSRVSPFIDVRRPTGVTAGPIEWQNE